METIYIKVTRINNNFHARLIEKGTNKVIDEMSCQLKCDVGYICKEMLRWYDKCGGTSLWAHKARERIREQKPKGPIKYIRKANIKK